MTKADLIAQVAKEAKITNRRLPIGHKKQSRCPRCLCGEYASSHWTTDHEQLTRDSNQCPEHDHGIQTLRMHRLDSGTPRGKPRGILLRVC